MHTSIGRDETIFDAAGMSELGKGAQAVGRSKDELIRDFRKLIDEGQALLQSTTSLSTEALAQAREALRGKIAETRTQVGEMSATAKESGRRALASTDVYVRQNPWPAVGIAAGAGLVIGILALRR